MRNPPAIVDGRPKDGDALAAPLATSGGAEGNRPSPVLHLIDHLLSLETPAMKIRTLNAQIIKRQNEEMGK